MIGQLFDAGLRAPDDLLNRVTPVAGLDAGMDACA